MTNSITNAKSSEITTCFPTNEEVYAEKPTLLMKWLVETMKPIEYIVESVSCWALPDPSQE